MLDSFLSGPGFGIGIILGAVILFLWDPANMFRASSASDFGETGSPGAASTDENSWTDERTSRMQALQEAYPGAFFLLSGCCAGILALWAIAGIGYYTCAIATAFLGTWLWFTGCDRLRLEEWAAHEQRQYVPLACENGVLLVALATVLVLVAFLFSHMP